MTVTIKLQKIQTNRHLTINYIDDSTNLISDKNRENLICYLTLYYNLLKCYYDANKLVINPDKTELLVSCKNKFRVEADKIKFKADIYEIEQKDSTKILGFIIDKNLNHDKQINNVISKVNFRLHTIKFVDKYMNNKVKIIVYNSLVLSIIRYVMPLLININFKQINTVNVLVTKAARNALGYHTYKWSNFKLLKYCNWLGGVHMLYYSTLCFVHKINFEMVPKSLVNELKFNNNVKNVRFVKSPVSNIVKSKSNITGNSLLFNGIFLYNKIPEYIKTLNINKFKIEIKKYIYEKLPHDKIINKGDYG